MFLDLGGATRHRGFRVDLGAVHTTNAGHSTSLRFVSLLRWTNNTPHPESERSARHWRDLAG